MTNEKTNQRLARNDVKRILPMYVAACVVLMCGIGAYLSTYEGFGGGAVAAVAVGIGVSVVARLRHLRQDTMFGFLAALVVILISWLSVTGGGSRDVLGILGDRNNFPGVLLAWFVILYSFAMVTDEVIIFSIVPSIALLGTVASDNLNADIVVYFLGLVVSAVFLLVYENILSRGVGPATRAEAPGGESAGVRVSLLMTAGVVAMSLLVGFAASQPLSMVGQALRNRTPDMPMGGASQFGSEVTSRYMNEMDLSGAPPHLSERVVMRVRTPRPLYWRAKVFNVYTGFSWTSSGENLTMDRLGPRLWEARDRRPDGEGADDLGRVPVIQHIEMEGGSMGGAPATGAELRRIRAHWSGRDRRGDDRPDHSRRLRLPDMNSGRVGREYTVLSEVSDATPDQLRRAGTDYPVALKFINTNLGGDSSPERRAIAERITAGATNPYDKAKALEQYLRDNFTYTLTPPRTPSTVDAVTYFLTRTKTGYCEIFASSMAVLCRELGIPARLATGFAPGEWTPGKEDRLAQYADALELPEETRRAAAALGPYGVSTVRESDLHAWTEVYFPGYGWVSFDPTSAREAEPTWGHSLGDTARQFLKYVAGLAKGPTIVLLGMAAVGLFLLKTYGLDTLRGSAWWRAAMLGRRSAPARARWDALYVRAHRRLRRRVGPKQHGETPYEYAARVAETLPPDAAGAFSALTDHYMRHAFRRADPAEADIKALQSLDSELRRALRQRHPAAIPEPSPS